jgi:hypothetical protein
MDAKALSSSAKIGSATTAVAVSYENCRGLSGGSKILTPDRCSRKSVESLQAEKFFPSFLASYRKELPSF